MKKLLQSLNELLGEKKYVSVDDRLSVSLYQAGDDEDCVIIMLDRTVNICIEKKSGKVVEADRIAYGDWYDMDSEEIEYYCNIVLEIVEENLDDTKDLVDLIMSDIEELQDEKYFDCDCGCKDKLLDFCVLFKDGYKLDGDNLYFDNMVNVNNIDRKFIEKIFDTYRDKGIYTVSFGVFCEKCLIEI